MARIAFDETAHAELAHDVDRWAMTELTRSGRARVKAAKKLAAHTLVAELREPSVTLRTALGLPSKTVQRTLARELNARLWS